MLSPVSLDDIPAIPAIPPSSLVYLKPRITNWLLTLFKMLLFFAVREELVSVGRQQTLKWMSGDREDGGLRRDTLRS